LRGETVKIGAEAGGQTGQMGGAQGGGFHHNRTSDRTRQNVGEELHGELACSHTAIDAQHNGAASGQSVCIAAGELRV